jgi:hypothetical protein
MRRFVTIIGFVAVFAALALADNFSGRLMDASCVQQKAAACQPSGTTTAFAIEHNGKVYKLDEAGNAKAVEAMKNRADRAANPNATGNAGVTAKITGTAEGDTIKVETLEIQ